MLYYFIGFLTLTLIFGLGYLFIVYPFKKKLDREVEEVRISSDLVKLKNEYKSLEVHKRFNNFPFIKEYLSVINNINTEKDVSNDFYKVIIGEFDMQDEYKKKLYANLRKEFKKAPKDLKKIVRYKIATLERIMKYKNPTQYYLICYKRPKLYFKYIGIQCIIHLSNAIISIVENGEYSEKLVEYEKTNEFLKAEPL